MGGRSLTSRPTGCTRSRPPQPRSHGASGGNASTTYIPASGGCRHRSRSRGESGGAPGESRDLPPPSSSLSSSLEIESQSTRKVVWGSVVRNLTQLYPGSQLPEKLVSNIRRHYDSLPLRFGVAAEA